MTSKMTPAAFDRVIEGDIKWLEGAVCEQVKQSSLEFDHIINTLRYAAKQYTGNTNRSEKKND